MPENTEKAAADKAKADKIAADKAAADNTATEKAAADKAKADATASKPVKVKFLRSHPAFGYFAGAEGEISQEDFDKYSKDGEFFEKLK